MKVLIFLYLVSQAYATPLFHKEDKVQYLPSNPSDEYIFNKCDEYKVYDVIDFYKDKKGNYCYDIIPFYDDKLQYFVGCTLQVKESELSY